MKTKSEVEAIYPLSYMQEGLLLHHLTSKLDQGFLNTECFLTGDFNLSTFKEACISIVKRHHVLRSTIHWKNLEKPLHVIHKSKTIDIEYFDLSKLSDTQKETYWEELKINTFETGAPLESGALLKINVIKISKKKHKLLWPMHHILLDGWSGNIIIKDLLTIYDDLIKNRTTQLDTLPNYKAYINWKNSLPEEHAKKFWQNYLQGYKTELLFSNQSRTDFEKETFNTKTFIISEDETNQIIGYCRKNKITTNTILQGTWSLMLSKYFNTDDVIHGTTVSGRSGDFPNIDLLTGMFMNVQPVRGKINKNLAFSDWFQIMQKFLFDSRKYEQLSLTKLYSYTNRPDNTSLFDSLLVFENYPNTKSNGQTLETSEVKSGLTSTYPITFAIIPGKETKLSLTTDAKHVSSDMTNWIISTFKNILKLITTKQVTNYNDLSDSIKPFKIAPSKFIKLENNIDKPTYIAPKNKTELALTYIWKNVLGITRISTDDDFFEIGGKSLLAIKMFSLINGEFKTKLSATSLLEYPTIAKLSNHILFDEETKNWEYIVPIRSTGTKAPLFCIHGGGGYVIFFNPLANALNKNIPVYALQPAGLNSKEKMHRNIESMSEDYAREIKEIQPKGPYNLLTYCFSPAVGIEIANIFKKDKEETNLIVIDSIIKQEDFTSPDRIKMRISGFLNRLSKNPTHALRFLISNNYERFIEPTIIKIFADENKINLENIKQNLIKIYVNYGWNKNHTDDVLLILTEKADKKLNTKYIESWEGITDGNVKVIYTSGKHYQLFESPHVNKIVKHIEKSIYDL